ncbi:hypothetical protein AB2N08_13520 [Massilia aurea]|uniref:hypothetical protein n=1 Tax=Massilia aurea TaxID=373040 RepID=UPI0034630C6B
MPIPTDLLATITAPLEAGTPDAAIQVWQLLRNKLDPLLGALSSQLLFVRSLDAHRPAYPWLPATGSLPEREAVFAAFHKLLPGLEPQVLIEVNRALLATYTDAICELIGASLATRFLRSAFPGPSAIKNTQENLA